MQDLKLVLQSRPLQRDRLALLLKVSGVELREIARDALFQLCAAALDFRLGEVPVTVVDRLELAAVDGDAGRLQETELATEFDEPCTYLLERGSIVLPEVSDCLEVGCQSPQQPHHFEIAASLAFHAPARMHAVQITVDVELQVNRGVVGGPPGVGRIDAGKAQILEIEPVDKGIDETNRIALIDPIIEAFWQQCRLRPIRSFDKSRHPDPRRFSKGIIALLDSVRDFSHSQGQYGRSPIRQPMLEVMPIATVGGALSEY